LLSSILFYAVILTLFSLNGLYIEHIILRILQAFQV
jgi:hypothetical protein